jgi:hypothetical protein
MPARNVFIALIISPAINRKQLKQRRDENPVHCDIRFKPYSIPYRKEGGPPSVRHFCARERTKPLRARGGCGKIRPFDRQTRPCLATDRPKSM